MNRGIYITANDKVLEQAIALMNSIRRYDKDTPVVLIPYNDDYLQAAEYLGERYGVTVYEDLEFIERLSKRLQVTFGESFFARPNQFRKQACWFGPFDQFLYIDTDIVVFEPIIQALDYLEDYDFLCCDYQHRGGLTNLFTPKILTDGVFTEVEVQDTFNGGFWGSKKGLLSEDDLYETFQACASVADYFDFSQKTSDQPIINYMILKRIPRRFNIVRRPGGAPGNWGGSSHFTALSEYRLFDPTVNQPLQYLHWAGIRIEPGCPYWDIWQHHRYLNEAIPSISTTSTTVLSPWQRLRRFVRPS